MTGRENLMHSLIIAGPSGEKKVKIERTFFIFLL